MPWQFGKACHIGGRNEQQDRVEVLTSFRHERHLVVLADGMGGHHGGALAAQAVVDTSRSLFETLSVADPQQFLSELCLHAHQAVKALGTNDTFSPGSTCILLHLIGVDAYWAHVGDSRLYHLRDGHLQNRTVDHSMLEVLSSQSKLTGPELTDSPLRNQLYMRLGAEHPPAPDFGACSVQSEDLFVLCSDGFWGTVAPAEVGAILTRETIAAGAEQLVEIACERNGETGDNIALALAQWRQSR